MMQFLPLWYYLNTKKEIFLDIFFNLEDESLRPFNKENNKPLYVHRLSNLPPTPINNQEHSSSEEMFETVALIFREALSKSGYNYELQFDLMQEETSTKFVQWCVRLKKVKVS